MHLAGLRKYMILISNDEMKEYGKEARAPLQAPLVDIVCHGQRLNPGIQKLLLVLKHYLMLI